MSWCVSHHSDDDPHCFGGFLKWEGIAVTMTWMTRFAHVVTLPILPFTQKTGFPEMEIPQYQWPFQEPKLEVPTIYKAYIRPM